MTRILRASTIGFPCDRHLWCAAEGHEPLQSPRTLRIFDVGTALEPVVIEWLRTDGWEIVFYNRGSQKADIEHTIEVRGGEIRGHFDAIIFRPDTGNVLIDIKTMNDRAFTQWKQEGTEMYSRQYLDQLHVYGAAAISEGLTIDRLGIVAVNKNDSEMRIELLDYSIERVTEVCRRAERIFAATKAPAPGELPDWTCRYCSYRHICDVSIRKADTTVGDEMVVTTDEEIIYAMEALRIARDFQKAGKDVSDRSKALLDEKVRQQGIKCVRGGSLILTLNEIVTTRFDETAFRKSHPALAQEFTKASRSVRYDIKEQGGDWNGSRIQEGGTEKGETETGARGSRRVGEDLQRLADSVWSRRESGPDRHGERERGPLCTLGRL